MAQKCRFSQYGDAPYWKTREFATWTSPGEKPAPFVRFLYRMIIIPRQARDKHRENSKKRPFFSQRKFDVGTIMNISGYENATAWEKEVCQSRRNAFLSNTWCNLTDTQNVTDGAFQRRFSHPAKRSFAQTGSGQTHYANAQTQRLLSQVTWAEQFAPEPFCLNCSPTENETNTWTDNHQSCP